MNPRAIIFDVYGTLLEVGPPPADAQARWQKLWQEMLQADARLSLAEFAAACDRVIAREHAEAKARDIRWPEVFWPDVASEVLPELVALPPVACAEFLYQQCQLWHSVRLAEEAAATLRALTHRDILLGIASNAQPYTLRELEAALAGANLSLALFQPSLCFWSFAHGFSKPDPHVFRLLTARLRNLGVRAAEIMMVGDQRENDINPARLHGWQTWLINPEPGDPAPPWRALRQAVLEGEKQAGLPRRSLA